MPVPPLYEQALVVQEVQHRLAAADRSASTLSRELERAQVTRQSLLREAFAGNLVPQNRNDEPASVLLEAISAAREAEAAARKVAKKSRRTSVPKTPEGDRVDESADSQHYSTIYRKHGKRSARKPMRGNSLMLPASP